MLKPLLKYPGGKTSELDIILNDLPREINNYIEPFVGGGAVFFALNNKKNYINDKSEELMLLYKYVKEKNKDFFEELYSIISNWEKLKQIASDDRMIEAFKRYRNNEQFNLAIILRNIIEQKIDNVPMFNIRKIEKFEDFLLSCLKAKYKTIRINEIKKDEQLTGNKLVDNLESGIKSAYYTYLRDCYNNPDEFDNLPVERKVAVYLFIREYCFSSMFRFNREGKFNVPYGGLSYNKKSLNNKLDYYLTDSLQTLLNNTEMFTNDFYDFIEQIQINKNDFMFLDPPYDTTFSEYDKNSFGREDQMRLANYLIKQCPCRFMLIIKKTDFIENLYINAGLRIQEVDKTYFVSFKNRNKKNVKHLIITNY